MADLVRLNSPTPKRLEPETLNTILALENLEGFEPSDASNEVCRAV